MTERQESTFWPISVDHKLRMILAASKVKTKEKRRVQLAMSNEMIQMALVELKRARRQLKVATKRAASFEVSNLAEELLTHRTVVVPSCSSQIDGLFICRAGDEAPEEYNPNQHVRVDYSTIHIRLRTQDCASKRKFAIEDLKTAVGFAVQDGEIAGYFSQSMPWSVWADLVTINHNCDKVSDHQKVSPYGCAFSVPLYVLKLRDEFHPSPERPSLDQALKETRARGTEPKGPGPFAGIAEPPADPPPVQATPAPPTGLRPMPAF